jgi:hypothetical protein
MTIDSGSELQTGMVSMYIQSLHSMVINIVTGRKQWQNFGHTNLQSYLVVKLEHKAHPADQLLSLQY